MNTFLLAVAGGCMLAAGLWFALLPRLSRPSLAELLQEPTTAVSEPATESAERPGWSSRLGSPGVPLLSALGLPTQRTRRRLAACDRDVPGYLSQKAAMAALTLVAPPVIGTVLTALGLAFSPVFGALVWVVFAAVLWMAPDLEVRDQARERSEQMRHTIAAVCDLVVISLAGGAGVTGALDDATRASDTWAMRRIRTALYTATIRHEPAWTALEELGERYDVPAATELAASLRLAGADGARVRASLAAKATSLRTQHLAELEAQAQSATERMSLPTVLLFAGFLILIGYPALHLILTSL
ncbi:type II secretion system F family protein [Nocardiopsis akebiae]|uniref:Type II secretion system F family protein n=1 Tax=Nocardiopsis akebiae TaxID=2831968 RepID=A0ABX8C879_9ACTN|nr:type II secretion system F family protein [Nocardiopsis akebiae]QUX30635.1 type II secretion system F family protein [Nocardiopsis akebiae]